MSGKRQKSLLSFWKAQPSKEGRSEAEAETLDELVEAEEEVREEEMAKVNEEETVEVREEETAEVVEEETVQVEEQSVTEDKKRALSGAATYRCTFKNEWTTKWPFITVGTTRYHLLLVLSV